MGGGGLLVIVVFIIAGAAANILPSLHRRDMFEIIVGDEGDTTARINTELVELDGFEIFGGFGYSNSLTDFAIPVVYKDIVNLPVINEYESKSGETLDTLDIERYDMEKETIVEQEIDQKDGYGMDESIYEEKGDPIEEEVIETVSNELTDEEFINESDLLEENRASPPDAGITDDIGDKIDNLDEIKIPEKEPEPEQEPEQEYKEGTSAESGDFGLLGKSILGEDETDNKMEKAFSVEEQIAKPDNLLEDRSEEIMNESMDDDDMSVAEPEYENELGISDSNKESTSFSFKILEKAEIDLEELSEEAKEMETNDELSLLQNQDEDEFTQSIAFSKCLETEKLVFASLFAIVIM